MNEENPDLEKLAKILEASGRYRILRHLDPGSLPKASTPQGRVGLFVDVETTGLDPSRDEIIELAMVPFSYADDGRILHVADGFQSFNEPTAPISDEIIEITGITNKMVAGHKIDIAKVASFVAQASLIIAHNARFDRRFLESLSDAFIVKPWACSFSQISWATEGYPCGRLGCLNAEKGFLFNGHRATDDCFAGIHMLSTTLPKSNRLAFSELLERARKPSWRVWAVNSPFEMKDLLKARKYRWNGDSNPNPKAWYIDVEDEALQEELNFLRNEIYQNETQPLVRKVTALDRFSDRA